MADDLTPEGNAPQEALTLDEKANRLRDQRDRLNEATRGHAARRDELNAKVRGLIDEANAHKAKRDALNRQVREAKVQRDTLNLAANEKAEALNALKKERGTPGGATPAKLRQEMKRLEFEQMIKVLTPKAEKDLIDRLTELKKELEAKEKAFGADEALQRAYDEMKEAKTAAEEQHRAVTALASEAQSEHDAMVRLFEEADTFRKQADAAQGEFVRSKTEADQVHKEYIGIVNEIRGPRAMEAHPRGGGGRHRMEGPSEETKAEAAEIFGKFKKGEKLSNEDLMTLQKAGLL